MMTKFKSVKDVIVACGGVGSYYNIISEADLCGKVSLGTRHAICCDHDRLVATFEKELDFDTPRALEAVRAVSRCDGDCPGCLEGNGAGCDIVAIFSKDAIEEE